MRSYFILRETVLVIIHDVVTIGFTCGLKVSDVLLFEVCRLVT
jgi:hypothetical protein